jgi:hypothetical protein
MLMLAPADAAGGGFGGALLNGGVSRVNPDGTFTISNVAPGSYTLVATSGGPGRFGGAGAAGVPAMEMAMLPITVGGDDLTGVSVVTGRGASVSGTVVATQAGAAIPTGGLQITTQPLQPQPGLGGAIARPARPAEDGTFTLSNLFGPRFIRVNGLPQNWMLKTVMLGGVDVTDAAVDFKALQQYKDAQIILTDKITEVNGKAAGAGSETALDYTVVIFPEDETHWVGPSRYIRSARPDQEGTFKIRAVPPNSRYLAVAVDYLEDGEANDPGFLAEMKARATSFSVGDGETKSISLKLVTR